MSRKGHRSARLARSAPLSSSLRVYGNVKMEKIKVRIKEREKLYDVLIGSSLSVPIAEFIRKRHKNKKIVVVTDNNLKKLCQKTILNALKPLNPLLISVPAGESSKSREMKEKIEDKLLEKKYGRDTIIIAFGGGVIGDLAGFVASTFDRGVPLIQVPTTLLAMVDSSIGGKTAINTKHGKNLIGTFYQPDAVFAGLDFLKTLPDEEFINGMAEIIKIASTSDKELFVFMENKSKEMLKKEKNALSHVIKRAVELKRDVVEKDEKESGLRQILNFGHTVGHALEAHSSYRGKHGHFVSTGIAVESKIAVLSGNMKNEEQQRIVSLLKDFSLPTRIKEGIGLNEISKFMEVDKKSRSQKPRFVILKRIGKIKSEKNNFSFEVDEKLIRKAIEFYKK